MSSFLTDDELAAIGFGHVGRNVRISRLASFHSAARIRIGDNTRIDDFCVLSAGEGGIEIGRNVHIAIQSSLMGKCRITLGDFANISSRVAIYSSNDDYSGEYMTNPTVAAEYTNITSGPVHIGRHVIIGSGSVVTLNVNIGEGVAVGALSLVRSDCEPFGIYVGSPARRVKERSRRLLEMERQLLQAEAAQAAG
jgi:galactoside O-acetyltransferase